MTIGPSDPPHLPRIATVDILRGLAVFVMVPANMAASIYEPRAFWFRFITSFAAPTFIAIAGMMTAVSSNAAKHPWQHYLLRGGLLLVLAAAVDVLIWKLVPFSSYDVLYLIGIAAPITFWFVRLGRGWQIATIAIVFALAPLLRWQFGYTDVPGETYLWGRSAGAQEVVPAHPTGLLAHLFIDGWFPLFPWLGIGLAGAAMAPALFAAQPQYRRLGLIALALLAAGIMVWLFDPGPRYVRDGYIELFYPATTGFVLTALGLVMALFLALHRIAGSLVFMPLRRLGESALLMYVLHLAIIAYILEPLFEDAGLKTFVVANLATLIALLATAEIVHHVKLTWPNRPYLVRFLLGG